MRAHSTQSKDESASLSVEQERQASAGLFR